jgi:hypothetical protein
MNYFWAFDGVPVKAPQSATWGLQDISSEDSGRTNDGMMHNNVVAQKRKLTAKWGPCTWAEAKKITQFCKNKGSQLSVTYPDIMTGTMATKQFYTGDCTVEYHEWHENVAIVSGISCDFIEI